MSKAKQNPTPEQRPDLYDSYDCRPGNSKLSQAYSDAVLPEHVKAAIAARQPQTK